MASDKKVKIGHAKEQRKEWAFEERIIDDCSLKKGHPQHYSLIKTMIKEEGYKGKSQFDTQRALCLDTLEIELAKAEKRNQRSTTDFAMGIIGRRSGKCNKRIRLVECKFDVNNTHNKLIEDLKAKNKETRDYFSFGCPIQKLFVVLLNDEFYNQGMRFIKKNFLDSSDCEVLTVNSFFNLYFER